MERRQIVQGHVGPHKNLGLTQKSSDSRKRKQFPWKYLSKEISYINMI